MSDSMDTSTLITSQYIFSNTTGALFGFDSYNIIGTHHVKGNIAKDTNNELDEN